MADPLRSADLVAATFDQSVNPSPLDLTMNLESTHAALLERIQLLEAEKNTLCRLIAELLCKNQILRQAASRQAEPEINLRSALWSWR